MISVPACVSIHQPRSISQSAQMAPDDVGCPRAHWILALTNTIALGRLEAADSECRRHCVEVSLSRDLDLMSARGDWPFGIEFQMVWLHRWRDRRLGQASDLSFLSLQALHQSPDSRRAKTQVKNGGRRQRPLVGSSGSANPFLSPAHPLLYTDRPGGRDISFWPSKREVIASITI